MNQNSNQTLPNYSEEIVLLLRNHLSPKELLKKIGTYHEKDVALALPLLTKEEQHKLFCILPVKNLTEILEYTENANSYFELLGTQQKRDVLSYMDAASATDLLQQLDPQERERLMDLLPKDSRSEISLIGSFEESAIGSKMSTDFIAIPENATIKEAMSQLVRQAAENNHISTLYLVDEDQIFCGAMDLKDLIIAREGTPISDITTVSYPYLYATASIDTCIPLLTDYAEAAIPVLNDRNQLIGVVTSDDFVEILDDEMGDDYAKLAGLSSEEDLSEPIRISVKKRIPWLCILLLLGLGVSATVGLFESIVAQLPVIMCFQSLILDMAGNVGTQSLAVAIRVLMDTQIDRSHRVRLVWKETRIGCLNGAILGVLSFAVIGAYLCLKGNAPAFAFSVSACLGVSMLLAMLISSLSGTLIPIFFQRVGMDPAVASGPLITTINDLIAVVTYYGLAWWLLISLFQFA